MTITAMKEKKKKSRTLRVSRGQYARYARFRHRVFVVTYTDPLILEDRFTGDHLTVFVAPDNIGMVYPTRQVYNKRV